jgi:uncharacterized DUF497 family protein
MRIELERYAHKAVVNAEAFGIRFEDATTAFVDPLSITIIDPDRSVGEARFILIAQATDHHIRFFTAYRGES